MDAGPNPGLIVTKPLIVGGRRLVVNFEDSLKGSAGVDEASSLKVGLLDEGGNSLDAGTSVPITETGNHQIVEWRNPSVLEAMSGRAVRLSFQMRNGKLYSFQFEN